MKPKLCSNGQWLGMKRLWDLCTKKPSEHEDIWPISRTPRYPRFGEGYQNYPNRRSLDPSFLMSPIYQGAVLPIIGTAGLEEEIGLSDCQMSTSAKNCMKTPRKLFNFVCQYDKGCHLTQKQAGPSRQRDKKKLRIVFSPYYQLFFFCTLQQREIREFSLNDKFCI